MRARLPQAAYNLAVRIARANAADTITTAHAVRLLRQLNDIYQGAQPTR